MQTIVHPTASRVREGNILDLSIVIPVLNEEENLEVLHSELSEELSNIANEYEVIYVDDGSTDGTGKILTSIFEKDKHVRVVEHRKNFGQTTAMNTGMLLARGDVVVTMDSDLQNDPRDISRLLGKLNEGYDVVSGWRIHRDDPYVTKRLPSKISNWLARKLVRARIHDFGCTLKAYRRETLENLEIYGDQHRYIPAIIAAEGFRMSELPVNHRKRYRGKSKYGASRLIKGLLDLSYLAFWIRYSKKPLHFFGTLGIFFMLAGLGIGAYKIGLFVLGVPLDLGPLLLFASISFLAGLQLVVLGFLGEIQIRTYYRANNLASNHVIKRVLSR